MSDPQTTQHRPDRTMILSCEGKGYLKQDGKGYAPYITGAGRWNSGDAARLAVAANGKAKQVYIASEWINGVKI